MCILKLSYGIASTSQMLNSFKPNGISHCYQLDQFISVLRGVGWGPLGGTFYSNFKRNFSGEPDHTSHLIWFCTVCLCPAKRTLCLYGLSGIVNSY